MMSLNNKNYLFAFSIVFTSSTLIAANTPFSTNKSPKKFESYKLEIKENYGDSNYNDTSASKDHDILSRKKRWITLSMCMNYPLCCDVRGKDRCGFFCPVCPIKRDYYGRPITTTTQNPLQAILELRGVKGAGAIAALVKCGVGGGDLALFTKLAKGGKGGGAGGGESLALLKKFAGDAKGGIDCAKVAQILGQLKGGGGGLLALLPLLGQGKGAGSASQNTGGKDNMGGMLLLVALMGMAAATKPDASKPSTPSSSDLLPEDANISQILKVICARPDIIKDLIRRDPERVRQLANQFGFGDSLPENLTPENLDLSPVCGKPGAPPGPKGFFGLPDVFANETVDVQGFGGDYDYDDDDNEIQDDDEYEDYDGDFEGENDLSNIVMGEDGDVVRRNFETHPSYKTRTRPELIGETLSNWYSFRRRVPKTVSGKTYLETYDTLHAPIQKYNPSKKKPAQTENFNQNSYPDVIALVDHQYIQNTFSRNRAKTARRVIQSQKRVPRLLKYN